MLNHKPKKGPVNLLQPAQTSSSRTLWPLKIGGLVILVGCCAWLWWPAAPTSVPAGPAVQQPEVRPEPAPLKQFLARLSQHEELAGQATLQQWQYHPQELQLIYQLREADWRTVTEFWEPLQWPLSTQVQPQAAGIELRLTLQPPIPSRQGPRGPLTELPAWPPELELLALQQRPGQVQLTLRGSWQPLYNWWQQTQQAGWSSNSARWQRLTDNPQLELQVQLHQTGQPSGSRWPEVSSPFITVGVPGQPSPKAATTHETKPAKVTPLCDKEPPQVQVSMVWRQPAPARALVQVGPEPPRLTWLPATISPADWRLSLTATGQLQLTRPDCPAHMLPMPG